MDWAPMWSRRSRTNSCGSLRCITPRSARERVLFFLLFLVMIDGLPLALAITVRCGLQGLDSLDGIIIPAAYACSFSLFLLFPNLRSEPLHMSVWCFSYYLQSPRSTCIIGLSEAGFPLKHDRATPLFSTYPFPCYLC